MRGGVTGGESMQDVGRADRWSRRLGLAFAAALAVIEVGYNWRRPSWWPFILVDYIAVALLLYGALRSPRVLAAGWGFACAMFYMAFFLTLQAGQRGPLLVGMGALFAVTVVGLALVVASRSSRRGA
jgi:hypothetical protein